MPPRSLEMVRSVSQLLYSYLPQRTVTWEDGGGVVQLGTPRLLSAWPDSQASFVLSEVRDYLERWRLRGGLVDNHFPALANVERFTVGTPQSISATVLPTAFYCFNCFRFLPRLRTGAHRFQCPECRRPTLRQVSYVFVHGCGELTPIRDTIPIESRQNAGAVYRAPIRCVNCGDRAILRMDARSERLSALRVTCEVCNSAVISRPLARCPLCWPRLFDPAAENPGQLAFRTAMRITRHSANNAYYPHSVSILRLDRPRAVQDSPDLRWLQTLLPQEERVHAAGVGHTLTDLVARLTAAEQRGDLTSASELRRQIEVVAGAIAAPPPDLEGERERPRPPLRQDLLQGVRESIALLSTVRRTDTLTMRGRTGTHPDTTSELQNTMARLGIRTVEVVDDLPVIAAVFGYSRRSADPEHQEQGAVLPFPTTLRPFPTLDDDAARVLGRPQAAGTTPILAREAAHEGLAIYLQPEAVFHWLQVNGYEFQGATAQDKLSSMLGRLEEVDKYADTIWECPLRRLVFGLLHSVSHCAIRALSLTAGLEEASISEYLFVPLLATVVYSTASAPLGGVRTTARDRLREYLETIQQEATRCLYDPDCLQRSGACHGCIHVPEIGCRVFNHGLSRAFLVGGHVPWAPTIDRSSIPGFWELTCRLASA
jgi:hypothetical protein